jgi:hypothetical protein
VQCWQPQSSLQVCWRLSTLFGACQQKAAGRERPLSAMTRASNVSKTCLLTKRTVSPRRRARSTAAGSGRTAPPKLPPAGERFHDAMLHSTAETVPHEPVPHDSRGCSLVCRRPSQRLTSLDGSAVISVGIVHEDPPSCSAEGRKTRGSPQCTHCHWLPDPPPCKSFADRSVRRHRQALVCAWFNYVYECANLTRHEIRISAAVPAPPLARSTLAAAASS